MDYSAGSRLYKHQWDLLHNPAMTAMPFLEDGEESMARGGGKTNIFFGDNFVEPDIKGLGTVSFTYRLGYKMDYPEGWEKYIPGLNRPKAEILATGEISEQSASLEGDDKYAVKILVPIYQVYLKSIAYKEYVYEGKLLKPMGMTDNWKESLNLGEIALKGFLSGINIGLSEAVGNDLSIGVGRFIQTRAIARAARIFKAGDEIAGIRIERVRQGTNGKYIVIGRSMDTRVTSAARAINAEHWTGFNSALSEAENLANNRAWLRSKLSEGYSGIDIGLDPVYVNRGNFDPGAYYSMELLEVFGIR
jgi:hypothetical protein